MCECPLLPNPEGEGWSHSWLLSGRGGGVGCHGDGDLVCGGNLVPFHPLLSHPKLLVMGRAQLVLAFPGGRGWTSVPRGHRARGEVPRNLKTPGLEQDALRSVPTSTASPGCVPAPSQPPSLPVSPGPQVRHRVPVLVVIDASGSLSLPYLRLGPQSTWPPGPCPAGSQAAAASVAGSCSPPTPAPLGPAPQGLIWGGRRGPCLCISLTGTSAPYPSRAPRTWRAGFKSGPAPRPSLTYVIGPVGGWGGSVSLSVN